MAVDDRLSEAVCFDVDITQVDGTTLAVFRGEVDLATRPVFAGALERLMAGGDRVVLDMGGLDFIDVGGARDLSRAAARIRAQGRALSVRNPSPFVTRVLDLLELDRLDGSDRKDGADGLTPGRDG